MKEKRPSGNLPEPGEEVSEARVNKFIEVYGDSIKSKFVVIGFATGKDSNKKLYKYRP